MIRVRWNTLVVLVASSFLVAALPSVSPTSFALVARTGTSTPRHTASVRPDTAAAQFIPGVPLLDQNGVTTGAAEPSIRVDTRGHVYVTGPAGVPTGGCPFWRVHPDFQNARGLPYEYLGKFDTDKFSAGGGDCDIATGGTTPTAGNTFDNLAVSSLSLADLSVNQSADGGTTFRTPANSAGNQTPGDDRQWNAADTGIGEVYLTVHDLYTDNIQISTSIDGGYTYTSKQPAIDVTPGSCGQLPPASCATVAFMDNHFGNIVVNPTTHKLYTVYVAPANQVENTAAQVYGAPPNEHVVYVAIGTPSCVQTCAPGVPIASIAWTDHVVYTAPTGDDLAHIFPVIGIDKAGTVYVAWSDNPSQGSNMASRPANHIFMSHSTTTDPGDSWATPVQVDQDSTSHSNMFPWLVGGAAGVLDLVWYSAHTDSTVCPAGEPTDDSQGVNNNCHNVWTTQFAQSFDADGRSGTPTFTQSSASSTIHNGSLCDQGLNCSLFGGDRTLLDYFQIDLDPAGAANIAYASDATSPGTAYIDYTRQCTGPSATSGGTINYPCGSVLASPPPPPADSCDGQNVVTDPAGDATNPLGLPGNNDQVDITNVSFSANTAAGVLTTTMRLANLSTIPISGTADTYYYVVWTYPGNGQTYATEVDEPAPSGVRNFFYGPFNTTNNQIITATATSGSITTGPNGAISVTVPLTGVGHPTIPIDPAAQPGAVPAVDHPYALTVSGEGVLGTGLVYTHPDDRAPNSGYGARWAVCPSGPFSSATPTVVPATVTNTPSVATTTRVPATPTATTPATGGATIGFGHTNVVDDQREGAEPDVKVCGPDGTWSYGNCGQNNPYASWPYGFSTTSSFLSRSEDQGKTFKLVPSNSTTGKPDVCPGGGDTDLGVAPGSTQRSDYLTFVDLQGLTNFSSAVSTDGGQTFPACNPGTANAAPVDRQWFGFYGNQAAAPALPPTLQVVPGVLPGTIISPSVYLDYDIIGSPTCTVTGTVPGAETPAGNEFVVQRSTDGGRTFAPFSVADCNDGIAGNMQVNQTNGHVFAIHTAYATPATQNVTDAVVVNRSFDGGSTWSKTVVFSPTLAAGSACSPDCTVGQDFAVLAIDKAGGLYAVWAQATTDISGTITGPSHIYYSYSPNEGATWTPEQQVDRNAPGNAFHSDPTVDLFPWIAAGNAGAIDVVWYGTTSITNSLDSGSQVSDWYPYLSQSLNANGMGASFSAPIPVSEHPNHNGGICTMGLGCTTGGDRSLADFFQVDVNKQGGADVIWADTSNNSNTSASGNQSALVDEARQISGSTLFGTTLSETAITCTAIVTTPCQPDTTGDARYEANGVIGNNVPKLDITGSSVNISPTDPLSLDVRMTIADLSAGLPNATDTDITPTNVYVDYLTSWNYHIPGNGQDQYDSTGNIYYAYLEVNRLTGAVTAYDGNTCGINTTRAKYYVYPGQHAIQSSVATGTGTIDLYVPRGDVGNPPAGATLYSVTAHTVGQPGASGPSACPRDASGNPTAPAGQIFDVYDKSPAYTSILAGSPAPGATSTNTSVPANTNTSVPVLTNTPGAGGTSIPVNTNTPVPVLTNTPVPVLTNTPVPVLTNTPVPGSTSVPVNTNTSVPVNTNTSVPVNTNTSVPVNTNTSVPVNTNTSVPVLTNTPVPVTTNTPAPGSTSVPVNTNTSVPVLTNTPVPVTTNTPAPGSTSVPVNTNTSVPVNTNTPAPVSTNTTAPAASTSTPTSTSSPLPTGAAPRVADTPTPTSLPPTATFPPASGATSTSTSASGATSTPVSGATSTPVSGATSTPVSGATSTPTSTAPSQGTARITLKPTSAHVGDRVTVRGTGFGPHEQITLALNGEGLMSSPLVITTRADGSFTASFVTPSGLLKGANTVSAVGNNSRRAAVAPLTGLVSVAAQAYFAGGIESGSEHSALALLNPSNQAARVRLTFYSSTSDVSRADVTVAARAERVVAVAGLTRMRGTFGLALTANQRVAAQLTLTRKGRDGDALLGAPGLARTWYLAEGYTGLTFHQTVSLLNPDSRQTARVRLRLLPFGGRRGRTMIVMVRPHTNALVDVNKLLPRLSLSVIADANLPVVVERTLRFSNDAARGAGARQSGYGLTTRVGTTITARVWLLAEGTTVNHFETYLTILNPTTRVARVTARFYGRNGRVLASRGIRMAGLSRANIKLNDVLKASGVASVVTSDLPVVVERPEYFGSPNGARVAGSDVFGRNGGTAHWSFPGGDTRHGQSEFLLLFNPAPETLRVSVTLYGTSGHIARTIVVAVAPNVRYTLDIARQFRGETGLHGVTLQTSNGQGFVAEQTVFATNRSALQSTQGLAQ